MNWTSCNSTYRLRYWNLSDFLGRPGLRFSCNGAYRLRYWNKNQTLNLSLPSVAQKVATALTACGIETVRLHLLQIRSHHRLQRRLLLAVLKPGNITLYHRKVIHSCNSTYRLRYWNTLANFFWVDIIGRNSTYCLWYCNGTALNPLKSLRYTKFTRAARGIESHTLITYEKDPSESLWNEPTP